MERSFSTRFSSSNRTSQTGWHRKARWMMRKVILNPPTDSTQMRSLCNTVVERRFGAGSPPTMIMKTALDLWQDPLLVNALQNNATYRSARERISRTAGHILPVEDGAQGHFHTRAILHSTQQAITSPLQQVLQCNVCGLKLHCLHTHNSDGSAPAIVPIDPLEKQSNFGEIEEQVEEFKKFTEGTVGRVPEAILQEEGLSPSHSKTPLNETQETGRVEEGSPLINWDLWFGPLVLATFATFGLVFGVWSGDISVPRLKNLTSRAVIAISAVMRVSDNLNVVRE